MSNEEMSAGTNAGESKKDEDTTSSPAIGNTDVVCSQSQSLPGFDISHIKSERSRQLWEEHLSNPQKMACSVMMICNPEKPKEECVLVLHDAYKKEFQYSDYLKTHKVVKLQTASCD